MIFRNLGIPIFADSITDKYPQNVAIIKNATPYPGCPGAGMTFCKIYLSLTGLDLFHHKQESNGQDDTYRQADPCAAHKTRDDICNE